MGWTASKLIISLIIVSLFAGVFGIFISGLSTEYEIPYDNSTIDTFNQLESISNTVQSVQNRTQSAERDSTGVVDAQWFL